MKTLVRTIVWLALTIWLGGMFFFVVTAAVSFSTVADTHVAGTIVAKCLRVLNHEGLVAGCIILAFLVIGRVRRVYARPKAAIIVTLLMMALAAFSQFWIMPRMERYRIAAGGAIDSVPDNDPNRAGFNHLHHISEHALQATMLGGIILIVLIAREDGSD